MHFDSLIGPRNIIVQSLGRLWLILSEANTHALELQSSLAACVVAVWIFAHRHWMYAFGWPEIKNGSYVWMFSLSLVLVGIIQIATVLWGFAYRRWIALVGMSIWTAMAVSLYHGKYSLVIVFLLIAAVTKLWVFWRLGRASNDSR